MPILGIGGHAGWRGISRIAASGDGSLGGGHDGGGASIPSRNFVEIKGGNVCFVVGGERIDASDDVIVYVPRHPHPLPDSVICVDGDRSFVLSLLGQNKFWTPRSMQRFTKALNDARVAWRWR